MESNLFRTNVYSAKESNFISTAEPMPFFRKKLEENQAELKSIILAELTIPIPSPRELFLEWAELIKDGEERRDLFRSQYLGEWVEGDDNERQS